MINDGTIDEPTESRCAINLTAPFRGPGRAEKNQVLESKKRFGFAVTFLLFQKGAQSEAAMMPDNRGGTESDDATGLLQTPAKINIVARFMIFGIKTADLVEGPAVKRHVTARNVFGLGIGKQDVARSSRRSGHARLNRVLRRRTHVRPANARVLAAQKRADQIIKPIRIGHAVRIGVGKNFALGRGRARIASVTQTEIGLMNVTNGRKFRRNLRGVIG